MNANVTKKRNRRQCRISFMRRKCTGGSGNRSGCAFWSISCSRLPSLQMRHGFCNFTAYSERLNFDIFPLFSHSSPRIGEAEKENPPGKALGDSHFERRGTRNTTQTFRAGQQSGAEVHQIQKEYSTGEHFLQTFCAEFIIHCILLTSEQEAAQCIFTFECMERYGNTAKAARKRQKTPEKKNRRSFPGFIAVH